MSELENRYALFENFFNELDDEDLSNAADTEFEAAEDNAVSSTYRTTQKFTHRMSVTIAGIRRSRKISVNVERIRNLIKRFKYCVNNLSYVEDMGDMYACGHGTDTDEIVEYEGVLFKNKLEEITRVTKKMSDWTPVNCSYLVIYFGIDTEFDRENYDMFYKMLVDIFTMFSKTLSIAYGNRAYAYGVTDHFYPTNSSDDSVTITMISKDVKEFKEKKKSYFKTLYNNVRRICGHKVDKKEILDWYSGEKSDDDLYKFQRYADLIGIQGEQKWDPVTRTLDVVLGKWSAKKPFSKIMQKAQDLGIHFHASPELRWSRMEVRAIDNNDLIAIKEAIGNKPVFGTVYIWLPDIKAGGWKGSDTFDFSDLNFIVKKEKYYDAKGSIYLTRVNGSANSGKYPVINVGRNGEFKHR